MRKIIALALITSFVAAGTAVAKTNGAGNGGNGGNGGAAGADANGNNGPHAVPAVAVVGRRPTYYFAPPPKREFCHTGGDIAASDNECSHYSR